MNRRKIRASGHGRTYYAERDQSFPGEHHHQHDYDLDESGINALFQGRGPGRILIVFGLLLAGFCFVGWASIVFGPAIRNGRQAGETDFLGPMLPAGVPIGVVYFLGPVNKVVSMTASPSS